MIQSGFSTVKKENKFLFSFKDQSFFVKNLCCCFISNYLITGFPAN
jgi:hypothetical protein